MPDMHELEAQGHAASNGTAQVIYLRARQALDVLPGQPDLSTPSTSDTGSAESTGNVDQETIVVMSIKTSKRLPDNLKNILENRAYDWLRTQDVDADVEARVWYELPIKEQA